MTNKTKLIKFCCFSANTTGYVYVFMYLKDIYKSGLKMLKKLFKKMVFLHKKSIFKWKSLKKKTLSISLARGWIAEKIYGRAAKRNL